VREARARVLRGEPDAKARTALVAIAKRGFALLRSGAGPTPRYYYDRPAIEGPDDRGGAMALVAAMERLSR